MEAYKCKKCGAEFKRPEGLNEFKRHCLSCKGEKAEDETENLPFTEYDEPEHEEQAPASAMTDNREAVQRAKQVNTCRGYYECAKDEICIKYRTCEECWGDFNGM